MGIGKKENTMNPKIIDYPYLNNFCSKCLYPHWADIRCDELRCSKIKLGMADAMCVQVSKCSHFKERVKRKKRTT